MQGMANSRTLTAALCACADVLMCCCCTIQESIRATSMMTHEAIDRVCAIRCTATNRTKALRVVATLCNVGNRSGAHVATPARSPRGLSRPERKHVGSRFFNFQFFNPSPLEFRTRSFELASQVAGPSTLCRLLVHARRVYHYSVARQPRVDNKK